MPCLEAPLLCAVRVHRVESAVIAAHVDGPIHGDGGRRPRNRVGNSVTPPFFAIAGKRMDVAAFVLGMGTYVDRPVVSNGGSAHYPSACFDAPFLGAVGFQCIEFLLPRTYVDGSILANGWRAKADVAA